MPRVILTPQLIPKHLFILQMMQAGFISNLMKALGNSIAKLIKSGFY